jgi:hypothetical protein
MTILELLTHNLPPRLRGLERLTAWLQVLTTPSVFLKNLYENYVNGERYKLQFNSQVMYLEHRLNDQLDSVERRIYIDDTLDSQVVQTVIYRKSDRQPSTVMFRKTDNAGANRAVIWRKTDLNFDADFVVYVPAVFNTLEAYRNIKNIVNYYRVAGRRFTIQSI